MIGMNGVVVEAEQRTECTNKLEFWLLTSRGFRHTRLLSERPARLILGMKKLPESPAKIVLSGQKGMLINGWVYE